MKLQQVCLRQDVSGAHVPDAHATVSPAGFSTTSATVAEYDDAGDLEYLAYGLHFPDFGSTTVSSPMLTGWRVERSSPDTFLFRPETGSMNQPLSTVRVTTDSSGCSVTSFTRLSDEDAP